MDERRLTNALHLMFAFDYSWGMALSVTFDCGVESSEASTHDEYINVRLCFAFHLINLLAQKNHQRVVELYASFESPN